MKNRSLQKHFQSIGFDINLLIDACFKDFLTNFLTLPLILDVFLLFLVEGVKVLYRYTYAILKHHKEFIKTKCKDPATLIEKLSEHTRNSSNLFKLHEWAFKYPLKRTNYDFNNANI